jgi:mono/diheme cytochrome c family protein
MRSLSIAILAATVTLGAACKDDDDGDSARDASTPADAGGVFDGGIDAAVGAANGGALTGAALLERGRYLVDNVGACGDCHTPRLPSGAPDMARYLAGNSCFADAVPGDPQVGCLATRNLTHHETGLKNRSDREIKDMFLEGLRPDGKALLPMMPYYVLGNMSDQDADAIVAYLRTVAPVDNQIAPSQPPFTTPPAPAPRLADALIPRPLASYPDQQAALRGRYLAGSVGVCLECHTPRDASDGLVTSKLFQGGNAFPAALLGLPPGFPEVVYSSNITPHANGIADRTVEDIVAAIKRGEDKDQGSPLCAPMPSGPMGPFAGITDQDARDIAHYLLSIAPGDNLVAQDCQPPGFPTAEGTTRDASM